VPPCHHRATLKVFSNGDNDHCNGGCDYPQNESKENPIPKVHHCFGPSGISINLSNMACCCAVSRSASLSFEECGSAFVGFLRRHLVDKADQLDTPSAFRGIADEVERSLDVATNLRFRILILFWHVGEYAT
jgi:hypothetical protein